MARKRAVARAAGSILSLLLYVNPVFGATLYVSSIGSGTACTSGTPCSLSYAVGTKCTSGDTIVVNPGTYADSAINLNNPATHSNVTLTTTDAAKAALTFTPNGRGIPTGTDNRPYFSALSNGLTVAQGVSGVTVEYLRLRGNANPLTTDDYTYVVGIFNENTTIQYCKIWNGGAAVMFRTPAGPKAIRHCELSNAGTNNTPNDTHMLSFCGGLNNGCGGTGAPHPTSWAQKTLIEYSTLSGTAGGDAMQFSTASHNANMNEYEAYVELSHMDFVLTVDEQFIDTKGAKYVAIHDCNFTGGVGYSTDGTIYQPFNTTYDAGASNNENNYWYVYNNVVRTSSGNSTGAFFHGAKDSNWWVWNNVIHDTIDACFAGSGTVYNIMMAVHMMFAHNTVVGNDRSCPALSYGGVDARNANSTITNNLFFGNGVLGANHGAISTADGNNAVVDYNFVYGNTSHVTTCPSGLCTTGTHYQSEAKAQLVDPASGNYRLASGVKSVHSGIQLADDGMFTPSLDKDGHARANPPSIGAYEFNGSLPVPDGGNSTVDQGIADVDAGAGLKDKGVVQADVGNPESDASGATVDAAGLADDRGLSGTDARVSGNDGAGTTGNGSLTGGCGCEMGNAASPGGLALVLLLLFWRHRPRRARDNEP